MALHKALSEEEKNFFQEKIEKNANNSKKLWKALKFLRIKSGKVNQLKIVLKDWWYYSIRTNEKSKYF